MCTDGFAVKILVGYGGKNNSRQKDNDGSDESGKCEGFRRVICFVGVNVFLKDSLQVTQLIFIADI